MAPSSKRHATDAILLISLIGGLAFYGWRMLDRPRSRDSEPMIEELLANLPERASVEEVLEEPVLPTPTPLPTPTATPEPEPEPTPTALPDPEPEPEPEPDPPPPELAGPELETEPDPIPSEEPEPTPTPAAGIWVRSPRTGENPIRVEDDASVNREQLADMAKIRNLSTDNRFPAPQFDITATGQGRLGTYVIANGRMVEINGELPAQQAPPRAWRLARATATEVHWSPVE